MSLVPLMRNPMCGHHCSVSRAHGFVVEDGCPVHDQDRTPFTTTWLWDRPWCLGAMKLPVWGETDLTGTTNFMLGLN